MPGPPSGAVRPASRPVSESASRPPIRSTDVATRAARHARRATDPWRVKVARASWRRAIPGTRTAMRRRPMGARATSRSLRRAAPATPCVERRPHNARRSAPPSSARAAAPPRLRSTARTRASTRTPARIIAAAAATHARRSRTRRPRARSGAARSPARAGFTSAGIVAPHRSTPPLAALIAWCARFHKVARRPARTTSAGSRARLRATFVAGSA